ncbi:protein BCCIP homolog [Rhagoletis pomonella]|uniref:protein BCCIP homolog n=1 Tax=Rhagoletis pomonella TaxID=28610 RepID=UPI001783EF16|nr:protein BCCIP homolog [Rhagoletis pomonella]XP_036322918.1 protein BCCIP homolog [Rhagoletis pomonella]
MSANKKKNIIAMEEDSADNSDSSSEDDGTHPDAYTGNEEVEVDFEGRAPTDPDRHGISQLLQRIFLKAPIDTMQMAEMIIGQNYVGSVICQCEQDGAESDVDDDMVEDGTIFGITTVVNMTAKKDVACVEQLRGYIVQRAEKHATDAVLTHFRDVLDNEGRPVGFLINERFINIPAQISVPLLENLHKEVLAAKQKGMKFNFSYYLMIVKLYRKEARKGKPTEDTFTNAEEEVICSKAVNSFEFSVVDECDVGMSGDWLEGDATLTPYRKIILFDAKQLPELIDDVRNFINGV